MEITEKTLPMTEPVKDLLIMIEADLHGIIKLCTKDNELAVQRLASLKTYIAEARRKENHTFWTF